MFNQLYVQLNPELRLNQKFALAAIAAALVGGVAGDVLFHGAGGLGLNVALWAVVLAASLFVVALVAGAEVPAGRWGALALATALACVLALRASPWLQGLNIGGAVALLGLASALPPGYGVRRLGFVVFVAALAIAVFAVGVGALRFLPSQSMMRGLGERFGPRVEVAGRVLAIATPLLLLFGGLFVAADAAFESILTGALSLDPGAALDHAIVAFGFGWLALGALWANLAMERFEVTVPELEDGKRLKPVEVGAVLGLLALLFAAFVLVQVRYLFGGDDLVERTTGLTYAEYARRGFFELVAVAALLLPVLLVMDWARQRSGAAQRVYRFASAVLVILLGVVMASAVERLRMYQSAFGLTELRLYSLAFLGLLAAIFMLFMVTTARGSRDWFYSGTLALCVAAVLGLSAWKPEATIARVNIERAAEGRAFDSRYLVSLSADAVPEIVANFDSIPDNERCVVGRELVRRWGEPADEWRSWNLSQERALEAVLAARARLLC